VAAVRGLILLPWLLLTGHTVVNALLLRRLPAGAATGERVAVLLPLRDEADRVTPCLAALLSQRGVPRLEIFVLDDGSTDGTAEVVRALACDRVRLLAGAPPPAGWLGKPHACHQLAEAAAGADVLSFVDADVVLRPDAIAAAVAGLRRAGGTLLSPYPRITGAGCARWNAPRGRRWRPPAASGWSSTPPVTDRRAGMPRSAARSWRTSPWPVRSSGPAAASHWPTVRRWQPARCTARGAT
jgi:glycosyltransferase involved in cell wall biosynthesis